MIKPRDDLLAVFDHALKKPKLRPCEGDIWIVTSKVVAVAQNCIAKVRNEKELAALVKKEADHYLGGKPYRFTVKDGVLIPRSGIDLSNSEKGHAILWPHDSWRVARELRASVCKKFGLKKFGVIITDSTCRPLRWGTSNIALAWAGFDGVEDARGQRDLFGKKLEVTRRALADSLAAAAYVLTGEAGQSIPFVLVRDAPVTFGEFKKPRQFQPKDCLFVSVYSEKLRKLKI